MDQRTGPPPPDREAILATLRAHRRELEAMGVVGLALFGSVARGEAGPGSDIDLAVRYDPARIPAWAGGALSSCCKAGSDTRSTFCPIRRAGRN
ncbi:MAG: nucleotidyltransferase domain-containing protein [Methylacidiphilales bacterium]|nr:nucleotidyltransferase domain-containing protein [Candidatus Methylacidiphilales bacterium]